MMGTPITGHDCSGVDCYACTQADIEAANRRHEALTTAQKAKKFSTKKRNHSVVEEARPVSARTVNHVAGDVPNTATDNLRTNPYEVPPAQPLPAAVNSELPTAGSPTPLQQPLEGIGPAHLSDVTIARGFILAGNAYFTVRSMKTGTRYTYRVSRRIAPAVGKKDCQCWKYPTYFVSLLTGPDNTGDYTYLGMIRENQFKATRATGAQEKGKPFAAFTWVWRHLGYSTPVMPPQTEIWHEGRCGRCGRKLTVPESIAAGIGPDCAGRM
jgi:hypothetical protein